MKSIIQKDLLNAKIANITETELADVMSGQQIHLLMVTVTGQKEMKKDKLCCVKCGKDITRTMKIYPHGYVGGAYCSDCAEAENKCMKRNKPPIKRKKPPSKRKIKMMHKRGLKPTEIAENMGITTKEVYEGLKT